MRKHGDGKVGGIDAEGVSEPMAGQEADSSTELETEQKDGDVQ